MLQINPGTNKRINFVGRTMLKLGGQKNNVKVVREFLELVKQESSKLEEGGPASGLMPLLALAKSNK